MPANMTSITTKKKSFEDLPNELISDIFQLMITHDGPVTLAKKWSENEQSYLLAGVDSTHVGSVNHSALIALHLALVSKRMADVVQGRSLYHRSNCLKFLSADTWVNYLASVSVNVRTSIQVVNITLTATDDFPAAFIALSNCQGLTEVALTLHKHNFGYKSGMFRPGMDELLQLRGLKRFRLEYDLKLIEDVLARRDLPITRSTSEALEKEIKQQETELRQLATWPRGKTPPADQFTNTIGEWSWNAEEAGTNTMIATQGTANANIGTGTQINGGTDLFSSSSFAEIINLLPKKHRIPDEDLWQYDRSEAEWDINLIPR